MDTSLARFPWLRSVSQAIALVLLVGALLNADDRFTPSEPITSPELFGQTIRATNHRSPAEELAGFHVPDGFEVDLIAAEPNILKPMNMAFGKGGKLWVTQSTQYPFPAKSDEAPAKDSIAVLEDRDDDGVFESSRVFADGLNIPIGLLPYGDGAICFSIPNLLYLRDTDGDGICDTREVILGPFDTSRDTHGMVNSLRMGEDGWVYACHGFNNQSTVTGKDGHSLSMTSGNVFRFRPDGARVELYTQGQVNPFGMARDRWGFWYAADCHSKPISQLIRGACYPSFGRLDDGLGFVPPMMEHLHGSTAISGLAHSSHSRFPRSFEDNFLSGNVMTCRINRNQLEYQGATAKAKAMPDLLTSDDPWFRPVDLQFGPDGHLYVADFYNKIIGHYEVPLDHPDRDRTSGRIWRVRWTGGGEVLAPESTRAASLGLDEWRTRIAAEGPDVPDAYGAIEVLATSGSVPDTMLARSIAELFGTNGTEREASWLLDLTARLDADRDPILYQTVLIAIRNIAIRLRDTQQERYRAWVAATCSAIAKPSKRFTVDPIMDAPDTKTLVRVLLAMKDQVAAAGVLTICEQQFASSPADAKPFGGWEATVQSISEVVDDANMERLFHLLDRTSDGENARLDQLLRIAERQRSQRGEILKSVQSRCFQAAGQLADQWLTESVSREAASPFRLISWFLSDTKKGEVREWSMESRALEKDLANESPETTSVRGEFFSSLTLGEAYTGQWVSAPFAAPARLRFFVVGHNGEPKQSDQAKNYVSLVKVDVSGNVTGELVRALPPRSDVAKRVDWDLSQHVGQRVQVRVVDGDSGGSYAWIGIGQCDPAGLDPGGLRTSWNRIQAVVRLLGWPHLAANSESLERLLKSEQVDWPNRFRLHAFRCDSRHLEYRELMQFAVEKHWSDLFTVGGFDGESPPTWDWGAIDVAKWVKLGGAICQRCSYKDQEELVTRLAKHRSATQLIATLCETGALSRDALRGLPASWWEGLSEEVGRRMTTLRPETATVSERLAIVEQKSIALAEVSVDLSAGAKQYTERCAVCHKLGDQGNVVGPQLEGIGARGLARLCEDILWPDRNVDEAFKMTLLQLEDGSSLQGLITDRKSDSLLLTDQLGKQRRIRLEDIAQEKTSKLSLMPGNFDELMTDVELASLIGFLKNHDKKR